MSLRTIAVLAPVVFACSCLRADVLTLTPSGNVFVSPAGPSVETCHHADGTACVQNSFNNLAETQITQAFYSTSFEPNNTNHNAATAYVSAQGTGNIAQASPLIGGASDAVYPSYAAVYNIVLNSTYSEQGQTNGAPMIFYNVSFTTASGSSSAFDIVPVGTPVEFTESVPAGGALLVGYTYSLNQPLIAYGTGPNTSAIEIPSYQSLTVTFDEQAALPGSIPVEPVPEPSSLLLLGTGAVGLSSLARKKLQARRPH